MPLTVVAMKQPPTNGSSSTPFDGCQSLIGGKRLGNERDYPKWERAEDTGGAYKMISTFLQKLRRTKEPGPDLMQTHLRRCLSTFDITLLGIGHMMGSGIYVISPTTAKSIAGPALIISYMIAGVASLLAALAYAEFGVRFPRAGSAYSYSYFSVGEFWAFFVGWNVVLENVIGISAVARACSAYIDSLSHGVIHQTIGNATGSLPGPYFSQHLDFLALAIIIAYVIFMSVGVNATSWLNNILCCVNIGVLLLIVGVGIYFSDIGNWTNESTGGFMPYGVKGVLSASASCFFAYVGFDAIAASGEEANNPQKSLPIATFISMTVVTVLYVGVSAVLTLIVNYKDIIPDSGLPDALEANGAMWAKYIVIVGALCGMSTVLIGTLFALTRIAYAMAEDGLLHDVFGKVNDRTKVPLIAMYVFSGLAGVLAVVLDIETLVEMMSIGTLFAYLVVSGGVVIFRYKPAVRQNAVEMGTLQEKPTNNHTEEVQDKTGQLKPYFRRLKPVLSNIRTDLLISVCVAAITILTYCLGFLVQGISDYLANGTWWAILLVTILVVLIIVSFFFIAIHEQSPEDLKYKMPLVPLLPVLSIVVNAALMTTLQPLTWLRLFIWVVIGLTGYFVYGIRHSKLNKTGAFQPVSGNSSEFSGNNVHSPSERNNTHF